MDDHMTKDAPKNAKKKKDWLRDDARLYLQIKNSIENEIIELVDHCDGVCYQLLYAPYKKITVELALFLPFSPDVKVQQAQPEKMIVMIFLNGLLPEFGMAKAHILFDSKIPSLDDTFTHVLRIESSSNGISIHQSNSALISKNTNPRAPRAMDDNVQRKIYDHRKPDST
ncbi:uncharacterized protein E5676_scaffold216G00610 [Cucumis melo var. makuwa]|uniref:Uncharacterized protein n=1 Tax=Cucumis melo var. makuwa TaxID=1194695 RepID=A0A5A7UV68_CUCMM|nr:uncharacterized protein E6C27_scaffold280G002610 [Cucumis melo var. makuwa]TYK30088.1 uncharacterized protein E5676_scaffold216G00610 [Cucumis melo var. makuwa]